MKHSTKLMLFLPLLLLLMVACNGKRTTTDSSYQIVEDGLYDILESETRKTKSETYLSQDDDIPLDFNTDEFDKIDENAFKDARQNPLSTFSIDVDNASYSIVRYHLENNNMPPKAAVRIEEMINYFHYDYPDPKGTHPFSINTELSECPWNDKHSLLHIGIQGKKLNFENLKPSNLVLLIDVSGSMDPDNRLPLFKKASKFLIDGLSDKDRVSIVVYAGEAGVILEPTPVKNRDKIKKVITNLETGGYTAGFAGIQTAYELAEKSFIPGGNNRIILVTDGDFNVGTSSTSELVDLVKEKSKSDIYLTILGMGMGNYKDGRMKQISMAGNGNYFYIDNIKEAEKIFVKDLRANLFTIAKDVKIQVEFNPTEVKGYRLIGYENRIMASEDFDDDRKDAGELGAGHSVTALYEIVPVGADTEINTSSDLRYQETNIKDGASGSGELASIKFRYKPLDSDASILIEELIADHIEQLQSASDNFKFSAAVAAFGMLLRNSEHKGSSNYTLVKKLAKEGKGTDSESYRADFIRLVEIAELLSKE